MVPGRSEASQFPIPMPHEPSSPSVEQFTAAEWVATPSALGRLSHDRCAERQGHIQAVHTERIHSALLPVQSGEWWSMKESSERFPDFEDVTGLNFSSFYFSLWSQVLSGGGDISGVKTFGSDKLLLHCVYLLLGQGDVQLTPHS